MISKETKEIGKKVGRILAATLILGVVALFAQSGVTAYHDYNSDKTAVDGRILSSGVEFDSSGRGGSYSAEIQYEYSYNGQTYQNDNIKPGTGIVSVDESQAERLVSQYPEDEITTVYVDTNSPSVSWLQDELPVKQIFVSVTASVIGLLATYNLLHDIRS